MCPIAHPCPQLRSRTNSGFTRVSPPVVIPFPRVDRQVEFWNGVLAQDLAECQRKDAVVLCWEKAPTRHEHEHTHPHGQPGERSRQVRCGRWCVHVSSVPRLLGALGTAPRRRVENEKWAATLPSGRGRRVSSSRNSSSAAFATIMAPIRNNKQIGDRIILCMQRRIGAVALPAFPGQSGRLRESCQLIPTHTLAQATLKSLSPRPDLAYR